MPTQREVLDILGRASQGTLSRGQQSQPTVQNAYQVSQQGAPYQGNDTSLLASIDNEAQKGTVLLEKILEATLRKSGSGSGRSSPKGQDPWNALGRTLASATMIGHGVATNSGGSIVAGVLNSLAMIPGPVGKVITVLASLAAGVALLSNALVNRAKEIQIYSGTIAGAVAKSDIRKMMADIREAQALGSDYSRLIEKQTDVEIAIRDAIIPVKKFLLEELADLMEGIAAIITSDEFKTFIKANLELGKMLWKVAKWTNPVLLLLDQIKKNTGKKPDESFDLVTPLLDAVRVPADPMPRPLGGPRPAVQIPLFN